MEKRITKLETAAYAMQSDITELKNDVTELKEDVKELKEIVVSGLKMVASYFGRG